MGFGPGKATAAHLASAFFSAFPLARLALWRPTRLIVADALILLGLAGVESCFLLTWASGSSLEFVPTEAFVRPFVSSFHA